MNKITIIFLIAFLYLTVWMAYECIECFFGKRIRGKLKEWRDNRAAFKLYEEQQRLNKIKAGKRLEVLEAVVEVVSPDDAPLCWSVVYKSHHMGKGEMPTVTTKLLVLNE